MDNVIDKFKEYLEVNKFERSEVAPLLGIDRTTLSKILNGNYKSDASIYFGKMNELMTSNSMVPEFVEYELEKLFPSGDAERIIGVCGACQDEQAVGLIAGKTGCGKTYTLRNYQMSSSKVIYIECDATMTCKDMLSEIELRLGLGLSERSGSLSRRSNYIKEFFRKNNGYLLIIDEADKLITRDTIKKIEILRNIHDQSPVGLIIAGEILLISLLKQHNERLLNRVDFGTQLQGLTINEVKKYVEFIGIKDITDKAMAELIERGTDISRGGCFRLLHRTLKNVVRAAGNQRVNSDHIEEARRMMIKI
jgi:DNA transposition AAA+ family ATPase